MMTKLIEILREDHRNIETLLLVLERELNIFDRAEQPDYEVMRAIIDYFRDYPDRCHHPKEDAVFAKLKTRDPAATASVGDLEAEHLKGAKRLTQVPRSRSHRRQPRKEDVPYVPRHDAHEEPRLECLSIWSAPSNEIQIGKASMEQPGRGTILEIRNCQRGESSRHQRS
jgi:hypothetical protein